MSIYGTVFNPRASIIYNLKDNRGALKLVYGEASQEPAPIQLFGGWSGRLANPNLLPEKARNAEIVGLFKHDNFFHRLSIFRGEFENVIKEEAENAGSRSTVGIEYGLNAKFENPMQTEKKINLYAYYTFTKTLSSVSYDFSSGSWIDAEANLGDISPHKVHAGINAPIFDWLNLNFRGQYISAKELYLRNALREKKFVLPGYVNFNGNVNVSHNNFTLTFRARNLFDVDYFHAGPEGGNAGTDITERSKGFMNPVVPQAGRNYMIQLTINY